MLTIGCHLSTTKGYRAMGETALSIGANTFAFFTRNPRGGKAKDLDMDDVAALRELMEQNDFGPLVLMPRIPITLARPKSGARVCLGGHGGGPAAHGSAARQLLQLPSRCACGAGSDAGIQMIVDTLCQVMFEGQQTTVLLETMAGKGTEVGRSFEELALIIQALPTSAPSCRPSWAFAWTPAM